MQYLYRAPWLILVLFVSICGCSRGGSNPIFPSDNQAGSLTGGADSPQVTSVASTTGVHVPLGAYRLGYDPDAKQIQVIEDRQLLGHINVTGFMQPPKCTNCLAVTLLGADPVQGILHLQVTLKNPFPTASGYDPRFIMDTALAGYELINPGTGKTDGYTELWDTWGEKRNPYIAFATDQPQRKVLPLSTHTHLIDLSYGQVHGGFKISDIRIVIDVSAPANCPEPYEILNVLMDTHQVPEYGGYVNISCQVHSWSGDIASVTASIEKNDAQSVYQVDLQHGVGDQYQGAIELNGEASPGSYRCWVTAKASADQSIAMWQKEELEVIDVNEPWGGIAKTFGWGGNEFGTDVVVDSSNNIYITGGGGIGFMKYDPSGICLLEKHITATGYSIALDNIGDIYVAGMFHTSVDLDPGPGSDLHISNGGYDAFIAKYDSEGNFEWGKTWGGAESDSVEYIVLNSDNNVYLIGHFYDSVDFDPTEATDFHSSNGDEDTFLMAFDPNGGFLWAKTWGGSSYDAGNSIAVDDTNIIYLTGYFWSTVDFDPGPGEAWKISNGGPDAYLSCLDFNGVLQWILTWGGSGVERPWSVKYDSQGYLYISGDYGGTTDFDPGPKTDIHISNVGNDPFVSKFDSSGVFQWARTWGAGTNEGNDFATDVTCDNLGNVYVCGLYSGNIDFDPDPARFEYHTSNGDYDIFLSAFDSSGTFQRARAWGGNYYDTASGIAVQDGISYATGGFLDTVDFDPGPGIENHTSNGDVEFGMQDGYISRLEINKEYPPLACATFGLPGGYTDAAPYDNITFDSSCSIAGDAGIAMYEWDWNNDGVFDEEGFTAVHTWNEPGTYHVQMRVTDANDFTDELDQLLEIDVDWRIEQHTEPGWEQVTQDIGPEGGIISTSRSQLIIPSGAVPYTTEFSVTNLPDDGSGSLSIELQPSGYQYQNPVVVEINVPGIQPGDEDKVDIGYWSPSTGLPPNTELLCKGWSGLDAIETQNGKVLASISHNSLLTSITPTYDIIFMIPLRQLSPGDVVLRLHYDDENNLQMWLPGHCGIIGPDARIYHAHPVFQVWSGNTNAIGYSDTFESFCHENPVLNSGSEGLYMGAYRHAANSDEGWNASQRAVQAYTQKLWPVWNYPSVKNDSTPPNGEIQCASFISYCIDNADPTTGWYKSLTPKQWYNKDCSVCDINIDVSLSDENISIPVYLVSGKLSLDNPHLIGMSYHAYAVDLDPDNSVPPSPCYDYENNVLTLKPTGFTSNGTYKWTFKQLFISKAITVYVTGVGSPPSDNTPPIWSNPPGGITSLEPGDKKISVCFDSANDSQSEPVQYLIYIDTDSNPWDKAPYYADAGECCSHDFTNLTNGQTYWFGIQARDSAVPPNYTANSLVKSTVPQLPADNTPPQWTSTVGITNAVAGNNKVTIYFGSATDAQSPPVTYMLYKDTDSSPWDKTPVLVPASSYTGSYAFTGLTNGVKLYFGVRVRDNASSPNQDWNTNVLSSTPAPANQIPIAYGYKFPNTNYPNLPVIFSDDGSYDPDGGSIVEWAWDFKYDGSFSPMAYGPQVEYRYTASGTYQGMLRVKDDEGTYGYLSAALSVFIGNPPAGSWMGATTVSFGNWISGTLNDYPNVYQWYRFESTGPNMTGQLKLEVSSGVGCLDMWLYWYDKTTGNISSMTEVTACPGSPATIDLSSWNWGPSIYFAKIVYNSGTGSGEDRNYIYRNQGHN